VTSTIRRGAQRIQPRRPVGRRSNLFLALFALVVVLNLIGLLMVLSASSVSSYYEYGSAWYQFQRQFLWLLLGAVALVITMRVDYHAWRSKAPLFLGGALVLLVLVLIPGLGLNVNGSSRWLGFGAVRIQPSEFAKLAVLLFVADLLARRADRIDDTRLSLRPVVAVFVVVGTLFMLQPNLGTTVILGLIVFVMMFVAGVPMKPLAKVAGVGTGLAMLFAYIEPYRYRRLMAFRDPWADPLNTGYQTIQSQVSISSGGLLGVGLGEGRAKWGFLPYPHTDFIFAVISEELGLLGGLTVVALLIAFGVLGIRVALAAPDRLGMLLATGVTTWILVQAFINIGAVVGALPITGVPLPFVSFGGSSLLVLMAASGLLLNIARQSRS
jgi:cell division protein FtsW